jgi:hypothetical protein
MTRKKIDPARIAAFLESREFTPDPIEPSARSEGIRGPTRIMYIENKSAGLSGGEARIGRVSFSKSGSTLYYRGRSFRSLKGTGFKANYYDVETGEEFWISGPKRDGSDRLYGERVPIQIDDDVRDEYWKDIRKN